MKNILVIIAISFAATCASAMWREGGGGRAVVCRDIVGKIRTAELLDLFEARSIFKLTLSPPLQYFDQEEWRLTNKLKAGYYNFHYDQDVLRNEFLSKARFFGSDLELTPVDDSFEPLVPKGCGIEQVVNYHQSGIILVSQEIWDAFNPQNQLALVIHEVSYKHDRDWGALTSSYFTRRFVGLLFSETKLNSYKDTAQYEVNYHCQNKDARLGFNMIYEVNVGGNHCPNKPEEFCEGELTFRTLNGQMVHDSTSVDPSIAIDFIKNLDALKLNVNSSTSTVLKSQVFSGMQIIYTIVDIKGVRTPQIALNTPGGKQFVDLECQRQQKY